MVLHTEVVVLEAGAVVQLRKLWDYQSVAMRAVTNGSLLCLWKVIKVVAVVLQQVCLQVEVAALVVLQCFWLQGYVEAQLKVLTPDCLQEEEVVGAVVMEI